MQQLFARTCGCLAAAAAIQHVDKNDNLFDRNDYLTRLVRISSIGGFTAQHS